MIIIELPPSKSYAQRYIIAALLATGTTLLRGLVEGDLSEDIEAAILAVKSIGARVSWTSDGLEITGTGGALELPEDRHVEVGESGFCARALSVVGMLAGGLEIIGRGSLFGRKLGVAEVLQQLRFCPKNGLLGGDFSIDGSISSQVLSGLLLTLPLAAGSSTVRVQGLKSRPYIDMTLKVLSDFGIEVQNIDYQEFRIQGGQEFRRGNFEIERDWSAGAYFCALGAIRGETYQMPGLNPQSLQADRAILQALDQAIDQAKNGTAITFDATDCPDLIPTLAALCSTLSGTSKIKGSDRLQYKESSRAEVLIQEWAKMGTEIRQKNDTLYIYSTPPKNSAPKITVIDPHQDHRIAMAAAIMPPYPTAVKIKNPEVTAKSFPNFWRELAKILQNQ